MRSLRLPHVLIAMVATGFFAAFAFHAQTFDKSARWFPEYSGFGGVIIAVIIVVLGSISLWLRRNEPVHAPEPEPVELLPSDPAAANIPAEIYPDEVLVEGEELTDEQSLIRGFGWFATWVGFVFATLVFGFLATSLIWLTLWFRLVHKMPLKHLVPTLLAMLVVLRLAETQLGMEMPGGIGWVGDYLLR